MTNGSQPRGGIGKEFIKDLYTGLDIETRDAQPYYILPRDTIKTFLYETLAAFGIETKVAAYAGIEITMLVSLCTATFDNAFGLPGNVIHGAFIVGAVLFAFLILRNIGLLMRNRRYLTVDVLTNDLGERGSVLRKPDKDKPHGHHSGIEES